MKGRIERGRKEIYEVDGKERRRNKKNEKEGWKGKMQGRRKGEEGKV